MMPARIHLAFVALLGAASQQAMAQPTADHSTHTPPTAFGNVTWRNLGPTNMGGRVDDIAVGRTRGQPDQIYITASSGGIFKSTNGGTSWSPVFDDVKGSMSMGAVAVSKSHPNVVWAGTGEETTVAYYWGDGVYKSVDGGKSWLHMGLRDIRHTGRIAIHPSNPEIVFVAAQGRMWGPNTERGVFKTTDGGRSWKKVLYVDENTGANDVVMDPTNPMIMYASSYQRQRKSYGGITVGPGSAIYKSTDGGDSWRKVTSGLPTVEMGRIGLDVSPVDPKLIYADIEVSGSRYPAPQGSDGDCVMGGRGNNAFESAGGVFRSTDGGETWEQVYNRLDQPAGYFVVVRADPQDRNRVYRLGLSMYVSDDQGKTFRTMPTRLHGDYHGLWIDPDDHNHMIVGNDGSVGISRDRGLTWDNRDNIPMAQYWEMSVDNRDPYWICGGTQDNGNWCMPSANRNRNGISMRDVFALGGGDGMHFHVDPRDTNYAFIQTNSVTTTSSIQRLNLATLQRQPAKPGVGRPVSCYDLAAVRAKNYRGLGRGVGDDPAYRWGWVAPLTFSRVTPGVVYAAGNALFKSTDRGGSWTRISEDLSTRVNRDTVMIMGKPVGTVNYSPGGGPSTNPLSVPLYGQVTWISESALNGRVLYTGTDDGQVSVTRDGGATWTNVTRNVPGLPPHTFVSSVLASRHVPGRVYATFDGHYNNDDSTYVFVSEDYGQRWRKIISGLPATTAVNRIIEHPRFAHLLVVSHAYGVHFSNDGGARWQSLATNLPTVPTRAIVFHERDNALIAGTYGRGIWVLDDVAPLEVLTESALRQPALFVSATRGRQWNSFPLGTTFGVADFFAPNPSFAPIISYYVRDGASGNATITIADATGRQIRRMNGPVARGLNRVSWDMRMEPAIPLPGAGGDAGPGPSGLRGVAISAMAGPMVAPGTYTVSIAIPGVATPLRGRFTVDGDPLERMTVADRQARQAAISSLYALQRSLTAARAAVVSQLGKMDSIKADFGGNAAGATAADSITARLTLTQAEFDRLVGLTGTFMRALESFNTPPTADQRQQAAWAREDAGRAVNTLNRITRMELPALYSRVAPSARQRVVPAVTLPPG